MKKDTKHLSVEIGDSDANYMSVTDQGFLLVKDLTKWLDNIVKIYKGANGLLCEDAETKKRYAINPIVSGDEELYISDKDGNKIEIDDQGRLVLSDTITKDTCKTCRYLNMVDGVLHCTALRFKQPNDKFYCGFYNGVDSDDRENS